MGGPGSGRLPDTMRDKKLRIIGKAWDIIENQFDDPNVPRQQKVEVAEKVITKDMPTQVEGLPRTEHKVIVVQNQPTQKEESVGNNSARVSTEVS